MSERPAYGDQPCDNEGGIGAGHDELTVRHVDNAHLAEGQRQAQCCQ